MNLHGIKASWQLNPPDASTPETITKTINELQEHLVRKEHHSNKPRHCPSHPATDGYNVTAPLNTAGFSTPSKNTATPSFQGEAFTSITPMQASATESEK